jgi:hypothetical protein
MNYAFQIYEYPCSGSAHKFIILSIISNSLFNILKFLGYEDIVSCIKQMHIAELEREHPWVVCRREFEGNKEFHLASLLQASTMLSQLV